MSNIFDSTCDALVNPVNCVGVMGAGLALEFKNRYPTNFIEYRKYCAKGWLQLGKCFAVRDSGKYIINLPTKYHWKDKSTLEGVVLGLVALRDNYPFWSIAIPALGCGLGGLSWDVVKPVIEEIMYGLNYELYEPQ